MSKPPSNTPTPTGADPSWSAGSPPLASASDDVREPGWYRDPEHPRGHRYWDGVSWRSWVPPAPRRDPSPEPDPTT